MTDELEIYYAILPSDLDDQSARELALEKARAKGLIPVDQDIEIRIARVGGREVRTAEVVCKKPKGRNLEVTYAPLYRGLVKTRHRPRRFTGQSLETCGGGPLVGP